MSEVSGVTEQADREALQGTPRPEAGGDGGNEIFAPDVSFEQLGLRGSVLRGVRTAGFDRPTVIQAQMIPVALGGRDILGQAKTGTGKTAGFGLPLLHLCQRDTPSQALILAPTRELAVQITGEINELGKFTPIRAAAIFGGERIIAQKKKLERAPQIIVGTPGRVMDMVGRRLLSFEHVRFVVLDEVDRMLDIGFREDIRRILSQCPADRQTIFVSATISEEIERLARRYMRDPEKIVVRGASLTVSLVRQYHLTVQPWDKRRLLRHLLTHEAPALTLVFCRLKRTVDELARYLREHDIDAYAIHGDMGQGQRNAVMARLRQGRLEVLIASDLASRGIDVEGITHVINYDLPEDPELYVHRIGRTARAGRDGVAWSFVTPDQGRLLTEIEKLINAEVPRMAYADFKPGPVPPQVRQEVEQEDQRRQPRQAPARFAPPPPPATIDPERFPEGAVPARLPARRLQGRVRTRRVR